MNPGYLGIRSTLTETEDRIIQIFAEETANTNHILLQSSILFKLEKKLPIYFRKCQSVWTPVDTGAWSPGGGPWELDDRRGYWELNLGRL